MSLSVKVNQHRGFYVALSSPDGKSSYPVSFRAPQNANKGNEFTRMMDALVALRYERAAIAMRRAETILAVADRTAADVARQLAQDAH